ncbi:MAG: hypothetical protein SVK08_00515 [Halobacteriota archaeon]|nr:hypothetical protein [Halobacteriota archaeon]
MKLDIHHVHILKLIERDRDVDGWVKVSESVFNVVSENIPAQLAIFEKLENGGRARLTDEGQNVLNAMAWL